MDTIITTIILSVIASSGFWTFLQVALNKKSTEKKALLALLHDRLYEGCQEVIAKKSVSAEDYENLMYLYMPYKAMGGNGTCERLMTEVEKLPINKEEN